MERVQVFASRVWLLACASLWLGVALAQDAAQPPEAAAPMPATVKVVLKTSLGEIVLAVETQRAPITAANFLRISRKEGQRFTARQSMVSRHVGPVLVMQDVCDFLSVLSCGQWCDGYPRARARAH
jgi:hypothetical protein